MRAVERNIDLDDRSRSPTAPSGKIYLVGAGPGDRKLITVKGKECLQTADVVVYDRLVNPQLLSYCPARTEHVYVGKRVGSSENQQAEINQLLIQRAQKGQIVVRLKGGDPLIFGRGGEEVMAIAEAGVTFEIVPGITAGLAVPAYAGIPVTHRDSASSVLFVTGHSANQSNIDWEKVAKGVDTIVVFMGVRSLPTVVEKLLMHGRSPSTPVAVIQFGTTSQQRTVVGKLSDIRQKAKDCQPPAVTVFGEVVELRQYCQWFDQKPLFGRTILITRPVTQTDQITSLLEGNGAEVISFPTVEIVPIHPNTDLELAIQQLSRYNWIIFTSSNAVEIFTQALRNQGFDCRALAFTKVCAVGEKTAQILESYGIVADFIPTKSTGEVIGRELPRVKNQQILLPRSKIGRREIFDQLQQRGAIIKDLPIYETVRPDHAGRIDQIRVIQKRLANGEIDMAIFTSPSTLNNFLTQKCYVDDFNPVESLTKMAATAIGQTTKAYAAENDIHIDLVPDSPSMENLAESVVDFFHKTKG
ncbi:MAG: uroporphyrinogen-III C-methyltransferase [Candidatus Poribacteria bacterium]|jgi:uroporphyrinogen III methyltransferase/synthase|nr:uroporphyrinogen-III C-methyltransferase [Candidatus Poribacteria bacterium]MDP6995536.1 uroporphyrinogen-III C-methyltransferase [Candidatus Poribacteria bacterium]